MTYEEFCSRIEKTIKAAGHPITWTEIRTIAKLPQKFPNNQWVHKMEQDIGLERERDSHGIILWGLGYTRPNAAEKPLEPSEHSSKAAGRKQGDVE
ncbi:MAG TPA: hypothetical protein VGL91_15010 [Acidobacteriota bacterium]|jgi:hypothetical protein